MIIRTTDSALLLITQPDHAALAARMMQHWPAGGLPASARRDEILAAVEAHDNGWLEIDAAPMVDPATGRIHDFMTAPDAVKQGVWPRAVHGLRANPYRAALVAHHAVHVYGRNRSNPAWAPFFRQMEALRDAQTAAVPGATFDQLLADYEFVRLGDLLSLTFCNEWRDVDAKEHGYGIDYERSRVTISPDPFGGREVPIEVAARTLSATSFASQAAAQYAFERAPRVLLKGVLCGR
jgi:hypothetical protein